MMLNIGSFKTKTCSGIGRRSFLQMSGAIPFGLGMSGLGMVTADEVDHVVARAKSIVFVFLWGAPSHLDTCDPKPDANSEYRGPFGVIPTRTPGVHFTELLPKLAQRSDKYTLIRSHIQSAPGHPDGGTVALSGFEENPKPVKPNFGSIIARHRGFRGKLPPFFSIANGVVMDGGRRIEAYGGGEMGAVYDPFMVGASETGQVNIPALALMDDVNPLRISDRRTLLQKLDAVPRTLESSKFRDWNRTYQQAYGLITDPTARQAFDLTQEADKTRKRYGQSVFGQSALLARRLVEAEVPYIQLNYSRHVEAITPGFEFGWDTHLYNFSLLQDQHCPIFDRAFSAFLDDIYERGLIDDTLIVCMGEFGRTPKINVRAARDHWPQCYFSMWAGAGLQTGRVIGESDKNGEQPITRPITPLMVGTTIAELAGVDSQARAEMRVLDGGRVIDELL